MGKNKKKYRFEVDAHIKVFKALVGFFIGISSLATLAKVTGNETATVGVLVGFWSLSICYLLFLITLRGFGYIRLTETGIYQRNRIGYTFCFYTWEDVKEVGYGTCQGRGNFVQYIYVSKRRLDIFE